MARKRKTTTTNSTVGSAVAEAFSEIDSLKEELQSWYDNLPENFQNGDKGQRLQEAIDQLESTSEPDCPDAVEDRGVSYTQTLGRTSRSARRDDACCMIEAAEESVRDYARELEDLQYSSDGRLVVDGVPQDRPEEGALDVPYTEDERDALVTDLESYADELDTARSEWESVEFPGMYG